MNTIKPTLTGMPVLPLQVPAGPPQTTAPEAQTPQAAPPAPVEIDLGSLLADQKQVDPSKRTGTAFDVKSLNFEQMAAKTLERVAQVRRIGGEGQPVVLKAGASQIVIPSAMLNKDSLVKLLTDTLARLSPTDLKAAMDLAQSAQPLVTQIRGESQNSEASAAARAEAKSPAQTADKPPETLDELFKGDFADEASFNKYAKGFFEGKLGVKSIDAGFIASYLGDALHGDNIGKRVRGLGYVAVRLHEISQRDPKVKDSLKRLIAQVEGSVPPGIKPVFSKLFTQKGPSLGHINNLYIVSQFKLDPPIEAAKTFYASFELLHHFGSDAKAFLPPSAQRSLDKLEALCGKEMGNALGKTFRKFLPTGQASDFSIALCKIVASDNPIARMAGVIDIAKLTGIRLFGDGGHFASLMSFAKIDIDTTVYMKQVLDLATPSELKAKALKNVVEIYQTRLDKFAAAFPPGTIPASVSEEATKLLELLPKDPVEMADKLAHYGLEDPKKLEAAMTKLKDLGVENQDQLLSFLQKMGHGKADDALKAVDGLKSHGITSLEQLGETLKKLGVRDAVGLEKAFKELGRFGITQADDALGLLEKLGAKSGEQALETLASLGIKPGKLSVEALAKSVEAAMKGLAPHGVSTASEVIDLIKRTGAKSVEEALTKLEKSGIQTGKEGTELLSKLGLKSSAQLTELLSVLGTKTGAEAEAIVAKFKAFGLKGDEVMQLMDQLGLKGGKDANKALELLKYLGVQAGDSGARTVAHIKGLGIRYIDNAAYEFQQLKKFGAETLEDAAEAVKCLGVRHLDEMDKAVGELAKAGISDLSTANKLFRNLGDVKNYQEALLAMKKLGKAGVKTPAEAIELMRELAQTNIRNADQVLDLFEKLGIKHFGELDKVMPQLEKLTKYGVNTGPELLQFISDMGHKNLDKAIAALEKLEKLGFEGTGQAYKVAKQLGLEKTGLMAAAMEKLGLRADKLERLAARLQSIGVDSLADAVELLEKTKLKNADELLDMFRKFDIYDKKTLGAMMEKLGCGSDLAKLGATLSKMKALAIDHIDEALNFASKLGSHSVAEAAELMGKFAKVGINHPEEVFKLLEKIGIDVASASPSEIFAHLERVLALSEEAARFGIRGVDDLAEAMGKTGAKTALELGEKMAGRASKVNVLAKALGLSDEAAGAMVKLAQNGHMSEEVLEKAMSVLKALGREKADTIARVLVHMQPDIVAGLFRNETVAKTLLSGVAELVPRLTKLGIGAAEIGAKLGKGVLKALPAVGIALSGADMIRTKTIALTGEWTEIGLKGFGKKTGYNADARGLAAIAGACNTLDTAIGVVEWAFPAGGPLLTAAPNIALALTEVALDVMMDHYNEHPMPAQMKNVVEASAYAIAATQLDVGTILALNKAYGKAAEHSGQAIATLLQDAKVKPADIDKFIGELSKSWTRNDDATRSLFQALESKQISLESLMRAQPPRLSQKSLQLLFDNLNSTMTFNAGPADYQRMEAIAKAAGTHVRSHMITALMDQHTNSAEESLIHGILIRASSSEVREILADVDVAKLAGELEDSKQFQEVLGKIVKSGATAVLDTFIQSPDLKQGPAAAAAKTLLESSVPLSDKQRGALFSRLIKGGDARQLQQLLLGNQPGGKLGPVQDKAELSKMVGLMASRIKDFITISGKDPGQASALAVMVLLHGNQQQVDQAFGHIQQGQWFGNGSDVVRAALDTAKRQGIDIKGKLSLNTLKNMVGTLDNGWTKAFRAVHVGKEHAEAERLLLDLARISDIEGKALIIKDIMDGVTFKSAQTRIATILREVGDPKEFTALIDKLDLSRLSSELEKRNDLGQVMADILQRYQGDKNQALRAIMSAWSSASIQSDDILHHMLKSLPEGQRTRLLRQLSPETLNEMIDWTDDAFRDGNLTHLDSESQWSIAQLQAAQQG